MKTRPSPRLAARPVRPLRARGIGGTFFAMTALFAFVAASPALADGAMGGGNERVQSWSFYFGPEIAMYAHTGKGNSSSTQLTGPRVNPPNSTFGDLGTTVSDPERSRETMAAFLVGGTFGVLTPALDIGGRPRAFLDLNISAPATTEAQLARRGNPGTVGFPRGPNPPTPVGEGALLGQGTLLSAQQQGPQIHAGLGFSVEFPIPGDQVIRVKPAAMYSRTILDLEAQLVRPVRLNNDASTNQTLADFRIISLRDQRTEVYHAAGPSLELEYLPGIDWGPFTLSLYARGHAAHILNTLKTEMQQCNDAGGQPNECVRWKYTQDRWTYRATLGVHLNWMPRAFW